MGEFRIFKQKHPWRDALIATTGLSIFVMAATLLWDAGHAQWAFAVAFSSIWVLISISWSNIDFTEQSGTILARIVDRNFAQMSDRIEQLEEKLSRLESLLVATANPAGGRQDRA